MSDPRAELVQRLGTKSSVQETLRRMESVELQLDVSSESAALGLSTANLCARLFPNVSIGADFDVDVPLFGAGAIDAITYQLVRTVRVSEPRKPEHVVAIGIGTTTSGQSLYCSAGVWNIRLSREPHEVLRGVGPAVAAASAIAAAQITRDVLPEIGGVQLQGSWEWNLLTYALGCVEDEPEASPVDFTLFGGGSVGSSVIYSLLLSEASGHVVAVDSDKLIRRNRLRYPLWTRAEGGRKVDWLREVTQSSPLAVAPTFGSVASYVSTMTDPLALAVSALDNVTARRDVVDALAETTLDSGVDGLQFHVSRHSFGDGLACAYCDYVDAGELMDQASVYSSMSGLSEERVRALLAGELLSGEDLKLVRERTGITDSLDEYEGARLHDLVRARLYAQAQALVGDAVIAISAPYVSALAGAVLASEVQKTSQQLSSYQLDRRIDIDCSGYPTGFVTRRAQDTSGRCLCASDFRLREYRSTWGGPDAD